MKITGKIIKLSATDLVGHLNCDHLTMCDIDVAKGIEVRPEVKDKFFDLLCERGLVHEQNYVDHLNDKGFKVVKVEGQGINVDTIERTKQAMRSGADVIVQAALSEGMWYGLADILLRVDKPSDLGNWSYEVIDTKLARKTKSGTLLQLSLYSEMIFNIQGVWPEYMGVVVPWSEFEPIMYRVMDYAAYFRYVKKSLENVMCSEKLDTYPEPRQHCDICRWRKECEKKRREDDHLSLVANISKMQRNELKSRGIDTAAGLAALPLPIEWKPERGTAESYTKIREQARVQVEARVSGKRKLEILPVEEGVGFNCMPLPTEWDIFFDIEGDAFAGEGGLEYLFGYQYMNDKGKMEYTADWALSFEDEGKMFEKFVDFVMKRWSVHRDLHIYHYAHYEPSTLKRLMGRHATREDEIDQMLRAGLFVDLYSVVRHSIRASVESYSIKKLEPFYDYIRKVPLPEANDALFSLQTMLELNDAEALSAENKSVVQGYNEDDCASTLKLRDWLEKLREQCIFEGNTLERLVPVDGDPSEAVSERTAQINALAEELTKDIPKDPKERSDEHKALWILANILDWHRREEKSLWWEYFRLRELTSEELLDERKGLSGLTYIGDDEGTARSSIHKYKFPPQETDLREGQLLKNLGGDSLGSVAAISYKERIIDIKKSGTSRDIHPEAVFVHDIINTTVLADSLVSLGNWVSQNGLMGEGAYQAARDLLLKFGPRTGEGNIRKDGEIPLDAALRVALTLEGGVFPIQGPPGAGKTYTGASMICELVKKGKKVGITANSHKVIRNLINKVIELAEEKKIKIKCVQKTSEKVDEVSGLVFTNNNDALFGYLRSGCQVAGGTAWLWSREDASETVDVLFVDEAAQMSLANVLAISRAGKAVILLGDPQQLDQPMQGSHPEGTDVSALNYILSGKQTISEDKGLFLEETWRLHPDITSFTSELFYDDKLRSREGLENQKIRASFPIKGSGLFYVPVNHNGNTSSSTEEAAVIEKMVRDILEAKTKWIDKDGKERAIELDDILIIAPYNAQVFEIQQRVMGARVGTVDKFQGQEAPITIYSMTTSSHADAPRGMEFLYSLNRLNVATSRARCLSILVASPQIFEPECRTPEQIKLANAFCRYLEIAEEIKF